jgi:DNA-binding MarR family transcriptional regulator
MRKAHRAPARVESIRQSMVGLRRLFQRKELAALWASASGHAGKLDYADLRLLDAVGVAYGPGGAGAATVGDVARLLGVDASRASRQVAAAVRRGLLARRAAQDDGRKVSLAITPKGAKLAARGSELTRARIALALDGWTAAEQARLAELLHRFVAQLLDSAAPPARAAPLSRGAHRRRFAQA